MIRVKRVYEAYSRDDGVRILVDGLWPRGVSKEAARVSRWERDIAPSDELRRWFSHDPKRWGEFRRRYISELKDSKDRLTDIAKLSKRSNVTLVYSAKDTEHNQAVVLAEMIERLSTFK